MRGERKWAIGSAVERMLNRWSHCSDVAGGGGAGMGGTVSGAVGSTGGGGGGEETAAAFAPAVSSVSSVSSAPGASSSLTCRLATEKQAGDHYVTTVALSIARAVPAVTPAHLAMRKQAAGEPRAKKWVTRKERGGKAMPWKVLPPCVSRSRQITLPSE